MWCSRSSAAPCSRPRSRPRRAPASTSCWRRCCSRPSSSTSRPIRAGPPTAPSSRRRWIPARARSPRCWCSAAPSSRATTSSGARSPGGARAMSNEGAKPVKAAGPSMPVQILGFEGVPAAGDAFLVVADANEAREIAQKRQRLEREAQNRRGARGGTLEDFSRALKEGQVSHLKIIIKADQGGPAEALADALAQLSTGEVRVEVVHRGVGAITESDVLLGKASGAIVLGFHVRPDANARAAAERESVDVRTYRIIYEAVEDVRAALEGLLKPEQRETVLGDAEVLQIFKVSKVGTIAGCMVRSGLIARTAKVRVVRDGTLVYSGAISSLKR